MGNKKVINIKNNAKPLKTRNQADIISDRRKKRKEKINSALKRNKQ